MLPSARLARQQCVKLYPTMLPPTSDQVHPTTWRGELQLSTHQLGIRLVFGRLLQDGKSCTFLAGSSGALEVERLHAWHAGETIETHTLASQHIVCQHQTTHNPPNHTIGDPEEPQDTCTTLTNSQRHSTHRRTPSHTRQRQSAQN